MPNVTEIKETALAVVTFFVRPSIFLLLGLLAGYTIGFTDAFRDTDTIGNKAARAIYKVHPSSVSDGIYQRASAIKDLTDRKTGIVEQSGDATATTPPPF